MPRSDSPGTQRASSKNAVLEAVSEAWANAWYQGRWWLWLLWPLSRLFAFLAARRRASKQAQAKPLSVPVLVVGNITVGGTGKTPTIIALVHYLRQQGFKPGVVSRGYGGEAPHYPFLVRPSSDPKHSGDEPLLIAMSATCPVAVDANRNAAAQMLIDEGCDILLSDDGLQHYSLYRHWELCLLDGERGWGNGLCLPAGPLREPTSRLLEVDALLVNGEPNARVAQKLNNPRITEALGYQVMTLIPTAWVNVKTGETVPLDKNPVNNTVHSGIIHGDQAFHAVSGIGNPQRFFKTLKGLGLDVLEHPFPDHYQFCASDFAFAQHEPILMTAKDAVKCQAFAKSNWWYLSVEARLPQALLQQLDTRLAQWR